MTEQQAGGTTPVYHPHVVSDAAGSSLKLGVVRTPAEAIFTATVLLEWAEKHGGDVAWYVTNKTTWDELPPEQRRRSSAAEDARRLAAHLRTEADRLEGKL